MPSLFLDDVDTIMLPVDVVQLQSAYINSSEPRIKCQYRKGFVPERNIFRYIKMFYDCIVFLVRIDFEDVPLFGKMFGYFTKESVSCGIHTKEQFQARHVCAKACRLIFLRADDCYESQNIAVPDIRNICILLAFKEFDKVIGKPPISINSVGLESLFDQLINKAVEPFS